MKKLMALLVVAGMVFVSCQQKPAEEPAVEAETAVEAEATTTEPSEVAPVEATTEETAPADAAEVPAN